MDPDKRAELKRRGRIRYRWLRYERRRLESNDRHSGHSPRASWPTVEYVGMVLPDGSVVHATRRELAAELNRKRREVRWKQEMARRRQTD
jgi:hypothetical protein